MASRHIEVAVAQSFVRIFLQPGEEMDTLSSQFVAQRCGKWCDARVLRLPTYGELADAMRSCGYLKAKSEGQRIWRGVVWNTEPDVIAEMTEPDALRRLTKRSPVFPLSVFIELVGIGRSTFYAMAARGDAPAHYRKGRRVLILATDAMNWCMARAKHGAVLAIVDRAEDRWTSIERARKQARH